ncbi:MAG: alpha/beta hydrolase [Pedobacter sp.]|nr:MAG: alpha/beta hydrolase [Pedobacter sp.]
MIYLISGLGADERVYQFLDLANIEHQFIKWNKPERGESLASYCLRLTNQINQQKDVVLIGVSFGGIIAQEISKIISVKKVIIISSVKLSSEYSWKFKLLSKSKLYRLAPIWLLNLGNELLADYFFSVENKSEAELLHQIIKDTDPVFLKWAIDKIMSWKNNDYPANLIHIHGTDDRIFPAKHIKNIIKLPKSGHLMIVNRAKEIEQFIFEHI